MNRYERHLKKKESDTSGLAHGVIGARLGVLTNVCNQPNRLPTTLGLRLWSFTPTMTDINFLFLDIETTGLPRSPSQHHILEIGAILTNDEFEQLGEPFSVVVASAEPVMAWDPWCRSQHVKSGLVADIYLKGVSISDASQAFVRWWREQRTAFALDPKKVQVTGSSAHFDMGFLSKTPGIAEELSLLSHRMFDLSSLRTAFKVAGHYDAVRLKQTSEDVAHRGLDDVKYDIEQARVMVAALKPKDAK